ncbi:TonB-dependent receptor [Flavobacterium akiainvivens]|uniref:TonB-dependent receptor n=1 Tax=Flavobacterium akiainvivens TaxID=1202724 RepID=A0A0M8MIM5_9FLAO|nr:TonB-dependent receptor [Flavobacterium akiainvivens]KOS06338.1 TonB-dependent receptor [Flavobacterium akiainvivens]SFQ15869.1 Carboxypeptidase regulatory-like domain-containing protein [Flavobacterium akiainvivens]
MKHIVSALLLLISATALAQNVKLSGIIKDSIAPLEMANIMAINKATNAMESYGITDDAGRYQLSLKANTAYILKASYIGYAAFEEEYTMPAANTVRVITLKAGIELDALEIVSEMPVTIKGDTIVYNSDSFTNGTERKLEDVLKKLPGVEVDSDGNVKVEGKSVTKLMVEGKDFFDGDTKLGVKNIPADALDKVEVLRNYNEVSQMKGLENNEENVAMNIKLKEGKKNFWFGDISASASIGEGERYLVNPKLFYYNPKYSINVIGNINNTGELPLSMQDYFNMTGGFRNFMRKGGTTVNVGSNDLGMLTLRNNRAKNIETKFGAANFSYNPSKAWTISGFGIFNSNRNEMETHTRNQILNPQTNEPETTQTVDDRTSQRTDFSLFKLSSSYVPNSNFHLDYDAFLKSSRQTEEAAMYSSVFPETGQSQDIYTGKKQNPFSFNQNLNLYYTLNDKNVFSFQVQQLYQEEDPLYTANLQNNPFPNTDAGGLNLGLAPSLRYDINQKRFVKTNKFDARADYYYMLTPKSNINLTLGATHSYQNFDSYLFQVLDDDSTNDLDNNTKNNVSYSFNDVFAALHFKFITGKFTFNPGVAAHSYSSYNEQLGTKVHQDFTRVLPDVYAVYQIKKSERLLYTYNMTTEFTDVARFAQGLVLNNYSSLFQGNRDLENALYQNHSLDYFKYNMFNFTQIFGNITYSHRMDAIKNLSAFSGINQVGTVENSNFADEAITGRAGYNRSFARYYKASVSANVSWSRFNNFRFDNGAGTGEDVTIDDAIRQVNEQFSQTYTASFGTNYKTWPNLELGYSVNINDYANSKFYTHSPFARMDYLLTPNITLTADYTYNHYYNNARTSDNEYDFLNAYVMYAIPNSKWEFKVGGTNLLNTGSLNDDSFSQFSTRTSRYTIQPRYLLLNIRYSL